MFQTDGTVTEMRNKKFPHVPFVKAGHGGYERTIARVNQQVAEHVKDEILAALKALPLQTGDTFCIGDYGCAGGTTSMELMGEMVRALKKLHGSQVPIQILYEDQPVNDFNSLFRRLHGIIACPQTYFQEMDNVFLFASAISFYQQCVPDGSMHVIISFFAVQWLSRTPTMFARSIYLDDNSTAEERRLIDDQAEKDWECFLLHRSKELRRGGILVIIIPSNGVPDSTGRFQKPLETFFNTLTKCWLHFSKTGKILQQEFINTNLDSYQYNLQQIKQPFDDTSSRVYKSGLRLRSARYFNLEDMFVSSWRRKLDEEGKDDRKTFAEQYVNAYRCFSNSLFIDGLSDSRSTVEKEALVDELFDMVTERVSAMNPEELKDERLLGFAMIYKV